MILKISCSNQRRNEGRLNYTFKTEKKKEVGEKDRKRLNLVFDKIKYNQRNIVGKIFFVVKRKLGESLRAREFHYYVKAIEIK